MRERDLGPGMRLLLGLLGAAALGAGLLVAATELRTAYLGSPLLPTLAGAVVCGIIALGGATLLRGALRGRIAVRRTGRRPPPR
jgi:hypothetical protein